MTIGQRFTEIHNTENKKAADLAREINVRSGTLSALTTGRAKPSAKILIPLAKKGININWLLLGDEGGLMYQKASPLLNTKLQLLQKLNKSQEQVIENLKQQISILNKQNT
ncbi:MAG: helix-turn-helix domain-containing protein [Aureispira sp.]